MADPQDPQNPPPAPRPLAKTPAIALNSVIDMAATAEGRKLYASAISSLETELYDCQPEGLFQFLKSLSSRAQEYGWDSDTGGHLMIPHNLANQLGDGENLVHHYGHISYEKSPHGKGSISYALSVRPKTIS